MRNTMKTFISDYLGHFQIAGILIALAFGVAAIALSCNPLRWGWPGITAQVHPMQHCIMKGTHEKL